MEKEMGFAAMTHTKRTFMFVVMKAHSENDKINLYYT